MSTDLILVGGGEHATVVADALDSAPNDFRLLGYVDRTATASMERSQRIYLGTDRALANHPNASLVLAVGAVGVPERRIQIASTLAGRSWATVIHPSAQVGGNVTLGPGSVVLAGAVIQTGAVIGEHCVINTACVVEHDVIVGSHSVLSPGVVVGGGVSIGHASFLGLRSTIRDHLTVGNRVVVAMGALVVRDADDDTLQMGFPARVVQQHDGTTK